MSHSLGLRSASHHKSIANDVPMTTHLWREHEKVISKYLNIDFIYGDIHNRSLIEMYLYICSRCSNMYLPALHKYQCDSLNETEGGLLDHTFVNEQSRADG